VCSEGRDFSQEYRRLGLANCLKINPTKTEITLFGSHQMLSRTVTSHLNIGQDQVSTSDLIKYLGVYLERTLTLQKHIQVKCSTVIYNIHKIKQIQPYIDTGIAKMLASAQVLSHLDYANSILSGLPAKSLQRLQRVQNWAAKVVLCRNKYNSSRDALKQLHCVKQRIDFKVLCLVFKCIQGTAPLYLRNLIEVGSYLMPGTLVQPAVEVSHSSSHLSEGPTMEDVPLMCMVLNYGIPCQQN